MANKQEQPPSTSSTNMTPQVRGLVDVSVDSVLQRHSTTVSTTLNDENNNASLHQPQNPQPIITETESVIEAERLNILARDYLSRGKDVLALETYQEALKCANRDLNKMKRTILEIEKRDANLDDDGNVVNDESFLFLTADLPPPLHSTCPPPTTTLRTIADVRHLKRQILTQRSLIATTVAHTLNNMGVVQEMLSRYDDALSSCREALRLYRELLPSSDVVTDPDVDRTLRNIAQMNRAKESHEERGRWHEEARRCVRQAMEARRERAGESAIRLLRRAKECYEEVLVVERRSLGVTHPNVAKTLRCRGCVKWKLHQLTTSSSESDGNHDTTASDVVLSDINNDLTIAVQTLEAAFGPRHPEVVTALSRLGSFQEETLRRYDEALRTFLRIVEADAYETEGARKGRLLNTVGVLYARRNDGDDGRRVAMEYFEASLAAYDDGDGEDDEDKAMVYRNLGYLQYDNDDYPSALQSFRRALQIERRRLRREKLSCHPSIADRLSDVAMVYTTMKRYGRALSTYERLLAMRRAVGDRDAVAATYDAMGRVHTLRGDDAMALICREKALDERRRYLSETDPAIASSLVALGSLRAKKCQYDDAMVLFEEAIRIYSMSGMLGSETDNIKRLYHKIEHAELMLSNGNGHKTVVDGGDVVDDCDTATTLDNMGCKLLNRGDYTGSLDAFRKALSLRRKKNENDNDNNDDSIVVCNDDDDPAVAVSLFHIATVYTKMERFSEAIVLFHEALSIFRTRGLKDDDERVQRIVMALRELDEEEEDAW